MKNEEEKLAEFTDEKNTRLLELLNRIEVHSTIDQLAEELREPIKQQVQRRIRRHTLIRKFWLNSAAAVLAVMLGSLGWMTTQSLMQDDLQYITQIAPKGIKSEIVLPDGSTVLLNGGTKLRYPVRFNRKQRAVTLDGEAFFDITPDPQCQFKVSTDCVDVVVRGTKFNVDAHTDDDRIKVTLESGRVDVTVAGSTHSPVMLRPGEQLNYNKSTGRVTTMPITVAHALSWREGQFYFEAEPLASIAKRLERAFDVTISIDADLRAIPFTGEFVDGENLEQVLKVISSDDRVQYTQTKNKISIFKQ